MDKGFKGYIHNHFYNRIYIYQMSCIEIGMYQMLQDCLWQLCTIPRNEEQCLTIYRELLNYDSWLLIQKNSNS